MNLGPPWEALYGLVSDVNDYIERAKGSLLLTQTASSAHLFFHEPVIILLYDYRLQQLLINVFTPTYHTEALKPIFPPFL